jgi:hypothetical protein
MHLYIKVLFSRESLDFRPKSHDICRTLKLSCWRFVLMCLLGPSLYLIYIADLPNVLIKQIIGKLGNILSNTDESK